MAETINKISGFLGQYRWLSNFWFCPVRFDLITFTTAEHAYQAMKCAWTEDIIRIRDCSTPGEAKRLGRNVTMRPNWMEVRDEAMLEVLRTKFKNEDLARKLIETGNTELIEENTWGDQYWGMTRYLGVLRGHNMLGKLLMQVRKEIQ